MRLEVIEPKMFSGVIADELTALIGEAVEDHDCCTIALSGGSTPGQVYRSLCLPPRITEIPWAKLKLFLGDERWVPEHDNRSNYHMIKETLLSHLRNEKPKMFPINTSLPNVEAGAEQYHNVIDTEVSKEGSVPCFDLMILGVGADGHTASLFPNSPLLNAEGKWCYSALHPTDGTERVTLSRNVITHAKNILFIVKGKAKADIVKKVICEEHSVEQYPSRLFVEAKDRVTWFVDSEAASKLPQSVIS